MLLLGSLLLLEWLRHDVSITVISLLHFYFEPSIFLTTSQRKVYFHCVHLVGMFACFDILLDLFFSIVKSSFQYESVTENKNNYWWLLKKEKKTYLSLMDRFNSLVYVQHFDAQNSKKGKKKTTYIKHVYSSVSHLLKTRGPSLHSNIVAHLLTGLMYIACGLQ